MKTPSSRQSPPALSALACLGLVSAVLLAPPFILAQQRPSAASAKAAPKLSGNFESDTGELVGRFVPAAERQAAAPWRFREGLIPEAMRRGHWVVLDELNLAEPQVLERLNPVLEQPPTLVLS